METVNNKRLRAQHRKLFMELVFEKNEDENFSRCGRRKKESHVPFREWVRSIKNNELMYIGKAKQIRGADI